MKQKDKFRYAEKCLYEYKRNIACLEILREDLRVERSGTDVHVQNYQLTFGFTGEPSNPVQARLMKIEQLEERIQKLERWTKPITNMLSELNSDYVMENSRNAEMREILELMYFGGGDAMSISSELNISRTVFYERRRELVNIAMMYLGL